MIEGSDKGKMIDHPQKKPQYTQRNRKGSGSTSKITRQSTSSSRFVPIYFYCEKKGHKRPHFRDYINDIKKMRRKQITQRSNQWIEMNKYRSFVAHTVLSINFKKGRYFDSVCSRHMTGDSNALIDIKTGSNKAVSFGDGVRGSVSGLGTLNVTGVPRLKNVMLV